MNSFTISLNKLEYGWAHITIADDKISKEIVASYVPNDVLEELVNAAIRLIHKQNSIVSFFWNRKKFIAKLNIKMIIILIYLLKI